MCPLLPIWISKNICKNTKPCEFTFVKNKELLALFLQQILRTLKMLKLQKPKNIQRLSWILLVLIKKSEALWNQILKMVLFRYFQISRIFPVSLLQFVLTIQKQGSMPRLLQSPARPAYQLNEHLRHILGSSVCLIFDFWQCFPSVRMFLYQKGWTEMQ